MSFVRSPTRPSPRIAFTSTVVGSTEPSWSATTPCTSSATPEGSGHASYSILSCLWEGKRGKGDSCGTGDGDGDSGDAGLISINWQRRQ